MFEGFVPQQRGKLFSPGLMSESTISISFKKLTALKMWKIKLHFAHGSNHSCGVMTLMRSDLDFILKSVNLDTEGCSIIMQAEVQGSLFLFVNIYAPNKVQDQCCFFWKI